MAKHKEEKTNVMRILDREKIPYTARFYEETQGPEGTREYGLHVAEALGQDPARGFKTLAARGASGGICIFEVPAPENLDLELAAGWNHGLCSVTRRTGLAFPLLSNCGPQRTMSFSDQGTLTPPQAKQSWNWSPLVAGRCHSPSHVWWFLS